LAGRKKKVVYRGLRKTPILEIVEGSLNNGIGRNALRNLHLGKKKIPEGKGTVQNKKTKSLKRVWGNVMIDLISRGGGTSIEEISREDTRFILLKTLNQGSQVDEKKGWKDKGFSPAYDKKRTDQEFPAPAVRQEETKILSHKSKADLTRPCLL